MKIDNSGYYPLTTILFIFALVGLVTGLYLLRKNKNLHYKGAHLYLSIGWLLFSSYWLVRTVEFVVEINNLSNAVFSALGVLLFIYIAFHEWLCYRRNEQLSCLTWLANVTCLAATLYFIIEHIPLLSAGMIYIVAWNTAIILNLVQFQPYGVPIIPGDAVYYSVSSSSSGRFSSEYIFVPLEGSSISIILACTGLQAIIVFLAFIACTYTERKKAKLTAFLITLPVIYLLNIIRNVLIVILVDGANISFEFIHNYIGKIFSLVALLILTYAVFKLLPELFDNIFQLFELPKKLHPRTTSQ